MASGGMMTKDDLARETAENARLMEELSAKTNLSRDSVQRGDDTPPPNYWDPFAQVESFVLHMQAFFVHIVNMCP